MQGLLGPDPKLANDILDALWTGCAGYTKGQDKEAAGNAFTECLCWLLTQVTARPCVLNAHTDLHCQLCCTALPCLLLCSTLHCIAYMSLWSLCWTAMQ